MQGVLVEQDVRLVRITHLGNAVACCHLVTTATAAATAVERDDSTGEHLWPQIPVMLR